MTIPKPEKRLAYSSSAPRRIAVHDFAGAAFLCAHDHQVLHVEIGHSGRAICHFDARAQQDLSRFFAIKEFLLALRDRAIAAASQEVAR
jgi:hypothetical protein